MSEIADFLRARIVERRALAVAASRDGEGRWTQEDPDRYPGRIVDERGDLVTFNVSAPTDEQAAHIAANDPAAVIADCDAKQRLLAALLAEPHATLRPGGSTAIYCVADSDPGEPCECGRDQRVSDQVRILAQQFAGHPGHKGEEWTP